MIRSGNLTTNVKILTCPACLSDVHAAAVVDPNLGDVKADDLDTVSVDVDPKIIGLAIHHRCGGAEPPATIARSPRHDVEAATR